MDIRGLAQELNPLQVGMLMQLMELDSMQDVMQYRKTLNKQDQDLLTVLMQLVVMEAAEPEIMAMESFPEVEKMLKKIVKK